jgi:hypothetical protein
MMATASAVVYMVVDLVEEVSVVDVEVKMKIKNL